MKILILAHRVPHPPNRGDRIRAYHLLNFLAKRAEVHLATLADEPVSAETLVALRSLCTQTAVVPIGRRIRWIRAGLDFARGGTATAGLFRSAALRRVLDDWSTHHEYDVVLVVCSSMLQYLSSIRRTSRTMTLCDLVDVDSQKWYDYAHTCDGLRKRLYVSEAARLRRLEQKLPSIVDAITLVSEAEAQLYQGFCPNSRTHAIPNGVDIDYFRPCNKPGIEKPNHCVFVGGLDYRANIDGIVWFCSNVWPAIRHQSPQARLSIVGRQPTYAVKRLAAASGVSVHANVPDVRPYLEVASVVVAPLRVARGIQNKVLEAMAMAKPVVASPAALEGLGATHCARPAASVEQWQGELVRLLQNAEERQTLGAQARELVAQCFSWDTQLEKLGNLVRRSYSAGVEFDLDSVSPNQAAAVARQ